MQFPRVVACSPFELPAPRLIAALARTGALAVVDPDAAAQMRGRFAVRGASAPPNAAVVIVRAGEAVPAGRTVFVEVTSLAEARAAVAAGAAAVIARGNEAGGRVGEETTFVLLQRLIGLGVPIYAAGGIGLHTAAAAIAGGAYGVVLDAQLALVAESELPAALRQTIAAMDGSETAIVDGRRVLARDPQYPVGQDAAFARPLADRFRTAANLVHGIEQAIGAHLRQAAALDPLAEHGRWARSHGLRYPIAQGPMTRVSDRAAFAASVMDAGALPFVALSLLRANEARPLLEETRDRANGRTWGVGILGFVPPELREEQLALIAEIQPPVALIAGGRPAQAKPLEDRGIATYLHVPSPGLLDLFLKDGARRFVLEGRECGGHVGPRSSFVLWEGAIERLARDPAAGSVSVLFAGGIHDARSAAMVAATAAPLAARGARIGVLMGTAYLFTEEAVASGAIVKGFQDAAIACDHTVLLDTAPGHSTRCAETPYVSAFAAERTRLEAEGTDPREVWAALEQLNVGRLRIAAKGLAREGDQIVAVERSAQERDGMVMIGQVAALRDRVVTMAELHADVASGARFLVAPPEEARRAGPRVAIVGMSAIFPGAPDLETYWKNIVLGVDSVTEVPRERWNVDAYYDPNGTGDKTPSKWGGFLPPIAFDPAAYGVPPRALAAIEPVQLLALEAARRALVDAGYADREFDREKTSVVFGAEAGTDLSAAYGFRALHRQYLGEMAKELDDVLPDLTEDSFPGVLANVIAGRIANRLDLGGVNFTVDAACASSLAALDVACKELATGDTDMVVCGGADLHNSITDYLMFASVHALSPTGRCKTFDGKADGIALGEGVAVLVLKRLEDAERDGDRIYAVVEGVGGSSDGKSLGLTAPRKEGQVRALDRAYRRAGVTPAEVELVEAHGTGTVVGDRTELETLSEAFGGAGARPGAVTLGSVKSNIGHTKCCAGLAGLVKVALAIHRRVLPPTLHVSAPNPFWDGETSPFVFRDRAAPWPSPVRRAAVSAFGFGGTNFHAVLSSVEQEAPASGLAEWPCELFVIRGDAGAKLAALAKSGVPYRLADLAASCAAADGPVKGAFVASTLAEVADKAEKVSVAPVSGDVAILFPGQGSQRPGMLDELFVAFPALQALIDPSLTARVFPGAAFAVAAKQAQRAAVTDTRVAQPALGMVDLAVHRLLEACGVRGAMLGGHSYGELVALCAAGAYSPEDLRALSKARAQCILDAAAGAPGTMAAVKSAAPIDAIIEGTGVVIANRNAPDQVVIAGPDAAVDAAVAKLAEHKIDAKRIPVACAFHSPVVAAGAKSFAVRLADVDVRTPDRPVYANKDAAPYGADVRATLAAQIASPVRFVEQIEAMYAAGARIFVEAGPGSVLTDLVRRILGDRPHQAIAIDSGTSSLTSFLGALARLSNAGVAVDPTPLFAGRAARTFALDAPPAIGPAATAWLIDGQRARPQKGEAPDFGLKPVLAPVRVAAAFAPAPADTREALVADYLRGMREMVASQKEVMLRLLGGEVRAAQPVIEVTTAIEVVTPAPLVVMETRTPLELLIAVVGERTGYPAEMLDPDLDLEADLGIDSIKRIEILGTLAERLGMGEQGAGDRTALVEELAGVKTLRGIAAKLLKSGEPAALPPSVRRYVLRREQVAAAEPNGHRLDDRRFALRGDAAGVAEELATLLRARGALVEIVDGAPVGPVDGIVDLHGDARDVFTAARDHATSFLVGSAHGGGAGLLKSVAKELPDLRAIAIALDRTATSAMQAKHVLDELLSDERHVHVEYQGGARHTFRVVADEPAGVRELDLGKGHVALITGGARGITARVALALAKRGVAIELVGRTPAPDAEDPAFADARDDAAIRKVLVTRFKEPAKIEAALRELNTARALRATFAALDASGASWRYHAADVRDVEAIAKVVAEVYARHGRLDAAIHGAGVIEDRLLKHKTPESFDRVFDTKVAGARALVAALRDDLRYLVFFSSVSGVFGNRGQVDYAAANAALDQLAHQLAARGTTRVLSVAWGPWAETGMISPELEREYARRGVGLIPPDEGVARLFDELARGTEPSVVLMSAEPEAMG